MNSYIEYFSILIESYYNKKEEFNIYRIFNYNSFCFRKNIKIIKRNKIIEEYKRK